MPSARFRVRQYIPALKALGINVRESWARLGSYPPASKALRPLWGMASICERAVSAAGSFSSDVTLLQRGMLSTFVTAEAGVNDRERNQQRRIRQGVRSGELTRGEFRRLEREQARVRRHEARARSDGRFTLRERARINRELNRSSRHIYRQKHNRLYRN